MNKRIKLALAIHNHQPVGNFDFVFEDAFNRSYLPFFELLEKYPAIRLAMHFTGPLLEWLQENRPDFLSRLRALVESGQVEMMSGGFYEPILTVIPQRDRLGQINKMNRFIAENTGYKATGMWLAERIWEPLLPGVMYDAGIKYVVLDDSHFKGAGLDDDELFGYYLTEDQGKPVALFPIIEKMRYNIPFAPPEKTIEFLRSCATEDGERLVVYADDGEKFGVWPKTFEHCYENGWLEGFFQILQANSDWIELIHLSETRTRLRPLGNIYLPTASYREMMEWAMPAHAILEYEEFEKKLKEEATYERYKVFVKGGFWRNFMAKYPEVNHMHKRMLSVSNRLAELEPTFGRERLFRQAQELLWAGQCNCPYWHGIFGGVYLNHLRFAIYNRLIQADTLLDTLERDDEIGQAWISSKVTDFDSDCNDEVLFSTSQFWLCFSPANGGTLLEFDCKTTGVNLLDTMTRREEAYHQQLRDNAAESSQGGHTSEGNIASIHDSMGAKEAGLEKKLHYDWYRRTAFIDHFLEAGTTLDAFSTSSYEEAGDFVKGRYAYDLEKSGKNISLFMRRQGNVWVNGRPLAVGLEKRFDIPAGGNEICVSYQIKNLADEAIELLFGPELSFALLAGDAPDRYYSFPGKNVSDRRLCSVGEVSDVSEMSLTDEWLKVKVSLLFETPARLWRFPIETISQSEGGFERVYQNSVVVPLWHLQVGAGEDWLHTLRLVVDG